MDYSPSENEQTRAINTGGDHHASGGSHQQHPKLSTSELLASAKVVADAARRQGESKVDKAEVAGAAANLLHAASEYGKFEDKTTLGKFVDKAENHLRQYHNSHSATATPTHSSHSTTTHSASTNNPGKDNHGHSSENSGEDHSGGKSKYGDYMKLAEGLAEGILKKHSGSVSNNTTNEASSTGGQAHSGSGNGYGEYVKFAGDFLKKH